MINRTRHTLVPTVDNSPGVPAIEPEPQEPDTSTSGEADDPVSAFVEQAQAQRAAAPGAHKYAGLTVVKARSVRDDWGFFMTIYGPGGSGKTTLAGSAAESSYAGAMAMLDAEGGARSIVHQDNLDVIEPMRWAEIETFTRQAERDSAFPWQTVSLDNICEMSALNMASICPTGQPEIKHWGENYRQMVRFVRRWRDIARFRNINVIIIAWDETTVTDTSSKTSLNLTPAFQKAYPGLVDIIGHLEVENNPPNWTRTLHFEPSPRFTNKFRRNPNEAAAQLPYTIIEPNMHDILAVLKGGEPWPANKHVMPARPGVQPKPR